MPKYGPSTESDLAEGDAFVRAQLLLVHALETGFRCEANPVTVFRDDLTGLGLLWVEGGGGRHPDGYVMQALCHRVHDHAQWRVIGFSPAWAARSRWMSYEEFGPPDLGVAVEVIQAGARPVDEALIVEVHGTTFRVQWDVPRPP